MLRGIPEQRPPSVVIGDSSGGRGLAAGIFASHGEPALAPLQSSEAFFDAYESERGARFSAYETEIAWAASVWEALHNARDELIYDRPGLSYELLKAQRAERIAASWRLTPQVGKAITQSGARARGRARP